MKQGNLILEVCGQRMSFFFFSFCSWALPTDFLSVDIIPDSVHANDMGERGVVFGSIAPPPLLLLFVYFFFSLGGAEVGWWAEARWEIMGMGSH